MFTAGYSNMDRFANKRYVKSDVFLKDLEFKKIKFAVDCKEKCLKIYMFLWKVIFVWTH